MKKVNSLALKKHMPVTPWTICTVQSHLNKSLAWFLNLVLLLSERFCFIYLSNSFRYLVAAVPPTMFHATAFGNPWRWQVRGTHRKQTERKKSPYLFGPKPKRAFQRYVLVLYH
uniref:Uncharacterized protein n=1 Tax=Arundo donax TaxID=35708 RepID=A0A0A9DAS1_ARUDO